MINEHSFNIPVYLDNMNNDYRNNYAAWPFRIYGFKNNKVSYISKITDSQYDILELFNYLNNV